MTTNMTTKWSRKLLCGAVSLLLPVLIAWGEDHPRVGSEVFSPLVTAGAAVSQHKSQVEQPANATLRVQLAPLTDGEGLPPTAASKRFAVGLGRSLPAAYANHLDAAGLAWQSAADGTQRAVLTVHSPGAGAVRLEVLLHALPKEAELAFFTPLSGEVVHRLGAHQALAANTGSVWSPIVEGDGVGLEVSLPASIDPQRVALGLGALSHLPDSSATFKFLSGIGSSGYCNVDVVCSNATPQNIVNSVAKYAFSGNDGFTYLCTGTLLNDGDSSTQLPYFLTAQHCVSSAAEAASMQFFWRFQRELCNGPAPTDLVTQYGGATLLVEDFDSDHSLVLLNSSPPAGVNLSGWDSAPLASNTEVIGLHHPSGDLKKLSQGVVQGAAAYLSLVDGMGDFLRTRWNVGTTEGGSSGSGIFRQENTGGPYLVGVLTGGYASCQASSSPDWYGRFDRAFPRLQAYLLDDSGGVGSSLTGLWWDPTRSGQGMQLLTEGNRIGGVWYLYDANGNAQWLTFVGDQPSDGGQQISMELLRFSGPSLGSEWNQAQVGSQVMGTLTLSVQDPTRVQAVYQLGAASGSLDLVPFRSAASGPMTGVWYNPAQSGRGLQLLEQNGVLEGVWYLYDQQGQGFWVTFQAPLLEGSQPAGLWRFNGPPPGDTYDPAQVSFSTVGSASVTRLDAEMLAFSYQLYGVSETVLLQPFSLSGAGAGGK